MPCYNAQQTVVRAINSIQAQSMTDWELIVVDDGSEDQSASIIAGIADKDPRVRLIKKPHEGVVAASNAGFEVSRGTLIARMDADDVSLTTRLEKQCLALTGDSNLGAVSCLAHFAGYTDTAGGYAHHVNWTNQQTNSEQIKLNRFIDLPFPHPTLMYRRELVDQFGGYLYGDFPEDYEMILRWVSRGAKIGKVNQYLYEWHDPTDRLSRNDSRYEMSTFHASKAPYLSLAIRSQGLSSRELWIWGAGRPARKCAQPLEAAWKPATGFIDIDPRKIGRHIQGRPVISAEHLPPIEQSIIASYVGTRGAREKIRAELLATGRLEGRDFWLCA